MLVIPDNNQTWNSNHSFFINCKNFWKSTHPIVHFTISSDVLFCCQVMWLFYICIFKFTIFYWHPPYGLFPWSKCDINLFGLKWGLPILKACRNFKFLIILKWTLNIKANAQTRVAKKLYFLMEVSSILLCMMKKFNLQHSNSWVSLLNKIKKDKINNRLK